MIEAHPNLFVGDESDALAVAGEPGWFVVHACKEPYHRAALGYTGRGAPKDHPEFLFAEREGCIALNLVDLPDPAMIRPEVVAAGLRAIDANIERGKVLVHCNRGESRAPTIALLWLALNTDRFDDCDFAEAVDRFRQVYQPFRPAAGMEGFARRVWDGVASLPSGAIEPDAAPPEPIHPEREEPRSPATTRAIFTL